MVTAKPTMSDLRTLTMRWVLCVRSTLAAALPSISPLEGKYTLGLPAEPPNLLAPEGRDVATATVRGGVAPHGGPHGLKRCFTLTAPFGASLPQAGESIWSEIQGHLRSPLEGRD